MLYNTWQPAKIQHSKSQSFIIYIDSEFTITICKVISNVTYQDTLPQTKIHAGPLIIYDDICSVIQRAVFVTPNILLLYPTQHHCHPRQHTLQSYRGYTAQHCPVCSHQPACCLYISKSLTNSSLSHTLPTGLWGEHRINSLTPWSSIFSSKSLKSIL